MATVVPRLLLASASPRRADLLRSAGLDPEIRPADLEERAQEGEGGIEYASRLAREKARAVARSLGAPRPTLGADTIVYLPGEILEKPSDAEQARGMLSRLAGRAHRVITAYHLVFGDRERGRAVETEVTFRPLQPHEIEGYVGSREWEGKAGGYAVQGLAAAFVREIRGSYTNIVGLPLCEVLEDLQALGALPADWALGPGRDRR
jgi:septum formation protein